jgi:hypothetical protein
MPRHSFDGFTPVQDSTHMDGESYDPIAKQLKVRYKNGYVYVAHGLSSEEYQAFKSAPSQGSHWHWVLRDSHHIERVK